MKKYEIRITSSIIDRWGNWITHEVINEIEKYETIEEALEANFDWLIDSYSHGNMPEISSFKVRYYENTVDHDMYDDVKETAKSNIWVKYKKVNENETEELEEVEVEENLRIEIEEVIEED